MTRPTTHDRIIEILRNAGTTSSRDLGVMLGLEARNAKPGTAPKTTPAPLQPRNCSNCADYLPATRECGAVLIRGRYPMTDLPVMGCGIWRAMALEIRAALPAQESDHE